MSKDILEYKAKVKYFLKVYQIAMNPSFILLILNKTKTFLLNKMCNLVF